MDSFTDVSLNAIAAIQEALLLAILRTTARCESTATEVTDQVRRLHQNSGKAIRRVSVSVCEFP